MIKKRVSFYIIFFILFYIGTGFALETPSDMSAKAKQFLREKNFSASMKYAEKLKKAKPKFHEGYQLAGMSFYGLGKYDNAIVQFDKAMNLFNGDYVSKTYKGFSLIKKENLKMAVQCLEKAIKMNEDYPDSRIGMGFALIKQKQYQKSKMYMKKAMGLCADNDPEVYKRMADIYMSENMYKDAAFVYKKFIEMEDSNPEIFFRLGKVYEAMKSKRAELAFSSAVDLDKKNPKYKEALADFWIKNGRKKDAIKLYKEAMSLGAKGWNTYYQIGLVDFGSGKYESAVKNMKKALSLNKKIPLAKMALSASYLRLDKYQECIQINNEIIKEDKKNDSAYFNNACSYAMLKQDRQALDALKMAVKLSPENKKIASSSKIFERFKKNKEFLNIVKE